MGRFLPAVTVAADLAIKQHVPKLRLCLAPDAASHSFGAGSASLPPPLGQAMALEDILCGSPCKLPSGTLSAPNYISDARLNNSTVWSKLKAAFQTMYSTLCSGSV